MNENLPGSNTTLPTDTSATDFMNKIQSQLLNQSGIISSSNTNLESKLQNAISGIKSSAESSNAATQSQFEREAQGILETGNEAQLAGRAAGQGGIMNIAALRELTGTTDKNLKDLAQRKQELILQNNAAAASKVAEMELKTLEFKQQAEQQVFSNLLGMSNFATQIQQESRLSKAQTFNERQALSSVALQYGLDVKHGDTLETIITRAAPLASKEQQLKLAKLQSDINLNNVNAAKAMKGDSTAPIDSDSIDTYAATALSLEKAGRTDEYNNIVGLMSKAGKLDEFYEQKAQYSLDAIAQEKASQEAVTKATKNKSEGLVVDIIRKSKGGLLKQAFEPYLKPKK